MHYNLDNPIAERKTKTVYKDSDKTIKLFVENYSKADILNEALNQVFDPNIHEAVMHIEDENYSEKQIVEEFRKGYRIGDKIIRHSMVKVAN